MGERPVDFGAPLSEELSCLLGECLSKALAAVKPQVMLALRKRCAKMAEEAEADEPGKFDGNRESASEWTKIDSLSRLRSIVGGRFENLKKKWLTAGLPLKYKKGVPVVRKTLEESGWIELSHWILKQGFECRPASEEDCFFEIRSCRQ